MPSVYLVGFMGCGKTSVGAALAERLGHRFVDLDALIAEDLGAPISELFATLGEERFRVAEHARLCWASGRDRLVVATGGGAYCRPENRALIDRSGVSVFLDLPFEALARRLGESDPGRPLYDGVEAARRLLERRRPEYLKATVVLRLSGEESPAEVAGRVADSLAEVACAT